LKKVWIIFLAVFEFAGLSHLAEDAKLNIVITLAFTPILVFIFAIAVDNRILKKEEEEKSLKGE